MKKMILAAMIAASVMAGATAASADVTNTVLVLPPPAGDGSIAANFGRSGITDATFTDTYTFTLPQGFQSDSITSILSGSNNNLTFTSATIDGVAFTIDSTGAFESRHISNLFNVGGTQTLVVSGTVTGTGAYGGTIAFTPGVPEPATWALMILGVGLAGGAIRMSRRQQPTVA